jgi:serine/threonine-protein kinase RsbW
MQASTSLSVPGTPAGIDEAIGAFDCFGRTHGVPSHVVWRCKLALDEILSNIARHGSAAGTPLIQVAFALGGDGVCLEIVDDLQPFNPLRAPAPDTAGTLESRKPGGLGIALVRQLMDDVKYERRDERNHFCLTVRTDGHH